MSAKTIVNRTDTWPIVVVNIYGSEHSEQMLQEAYAAWTEYMKQGPHVLMLDLTEGNAGATAAQRAKLASWLEANEELLKSKRQLAHILIFNSPLVRGIVTAVNWLRPSVNPHFTARDIDAAVDIAVKSLKEAGIAVDPALIAAARRAGSEKAGRRTG